MSYLTDYKEINGGYVAFGGNPKGGKITRKGTIKTGNLDFKNVCFVKELKFNLFSVSKMCDKKNIVLFNDTKCIVLSPNFKLIDESQVLIRVSRKNNKYSVDLKNIVPKGCLTCLFAKATSDESKLWHRRLGHLNFKTMNKLVKGNLIREAINTACYVKNRVLVVKPHNKTPYELFHGSRPDWLFDIDALTRTMNYEPIVIGTQSNSFKDLKSSHDDGSKPSSDDGKKVDEDPRNESECKDQEKEDNVNSLTVNVTGTNEDKELPFDPNMPALEDVSTFNFLNDDEDDGAMADMNNLDTTIQDNVSTFNFLNDDEDDGAMADMNNLDTTIQDSPVLTTRIHKDHPLDQVIGDLQSATQTRKMSKNLEEHGCVRITQKVNHALKDLSWIEDMQEELLQFKLQEVWTLVNLPNEKGAIGTKWVFRNKKDERGIVIRNKARLVAQGKIKEEVYVCQQLGFEDPDFLDRVYKVEKALYGLHICWTMGSKEGKLTRPYSSKSIKVSSMEELTFFLGLQVKQKKDGTFISQDKYVAKILKKFRFTKVKTASTPMET
nr:ribonuclease H-like domain-containing protein [Tanacetum cinerariifolium]